MPNPGSLRERFEAAHRLHQQGRLAEAESAYAGLLTHIPNHPELLRLLGLLKYQAGDADGAVSHLRAAVAAGARDGRALEALGCILGETGRRDEAIDCLRQVATADPGRASALMNLGMLLIEEPERQAEAVDAFRRVIALDPDNRRARESLARALLCVRQPAEALEEIDRVLERSPGDVHALAHKCAALSLLGDTDAVHSLADLGLLHFDSFAGGDGFVDAEALNARLAEHILEHPTLGVERTTSNGMDTGEILRSDHPAILALVAFITGSIRRMIDALDLDPAHPFIASRPEAWHLSGWGVRMWRGGFQIPHYHKDAWISGVYYVHLPPSVRAGGSDEAGWIEFGRGPDDIYHDSVPETRRIPPQEGKLIAFPSHFWHRTLPFDDDEDRLCISFNVVRDRP